jgi:hypothetical protein
MYDFLPTDIISPDVLEERYRRKLLRLLRRQARIFRRRRVLKQLLFLE